MTPNQSAREAGAATPEHVLRNRIMNPNVPKNEQEHWAARRIEDLEEALRLSSGGQGWQEKAGAPRDGSEFQVWWRGQWQPRARFDPDTHAFELWGRTDYDTEGWETFSWADTVAWMPQPSAPDHPQQQGEKP